MGTAQRRFERGPRPCIGTPSLESVREAAGLTHRQPKVAAPEGLSNRFVSDQMR